MLPKKSLIIVPELSDWYLAVATEASLFLLNRGHEVNLQILNLLKEDISHSVRSMIGLLNDFNVNVEIYQKIDFTIPRIKTWRLKYFHREYKLQKYCYPTLVEIGHKWQINIWIPRNIWRILKQLYLAKATWNKMTKIPLGKYTNLYTINGRYTVSATVVGYCNSVGRKISILEYGAGKNRFRIFPSNAQSSTELETLVKLDWEIAPLNERKTIAHEYFQMKKKRDPITGLSWTKNMQLGYIPDLPNDRKICVFYTTSQIEFVANKLHESEDEFMSQSNAIKMLVETLDPTKWHIVIRRHPILAENKKNSSLEENLNGIYAFSGVTIVEGNSKVDSYTLAENADLVVTYGSSIGAEITYWELAPVITLTNTPWRFCDPDRHVTNFSKLEKLLRSNIKVIPSESILPYGYSAARGGLRFQYLNYKDGTWLLKKFE